MPVDSKRFSVGRFLGVLAALCALFVQACGGDRAAPTNTTPTSITVPDGSAVVQVKVTLPSGAPGVPTLSLSNVIGSVSIGSNGLFALPVYADGPQFAYLTAPNGNMVGLGFVSSAAATIDATSTAKVLIYFAGAFYSLPLPYRVDILEEITSVPGFADVVSAVSAAMIAGGVDTSSTSTGSPALAAAVKTFVDSLYAPQAQSQAASVVQLLSRRVKDVRVTPATAASGITVVNDFPNGVHFMNDYRRLVTAYFDKVSSTDAQGNVKSTPVTNVITPVQIPPTSGASNFTGTAIDAARVLGGDSGEYGPVSTSSVPLALDDGYAKTTYNVTVVGIGLPGGFIPITDEQQKRQNELVIQQILQNYIVPLTCSIILPLRASQIDNFFLYANANGVLSDFIGTLAVQAPQIYTLTDQGNVFGAAELLFNTIAGSNALQGALLQLVRNVILIEAGDAVAQTATAYANRLLLVLNVVSGLTTSFDLAVLSAQVAQSHHAEQFVVDVTQDKLNLNPQSVTIAPTVTQDFVANVPSAADSGQTIVYTWTNTAAQGHLIDGLDGHRDNFDSSRGTVTYVPLSNGNGEDLISVTAYRINGNERDLIGQKTATVTVAANPWVGVWIGATTSTCGFYSGPLTLTITSTGPNTLYQDIGGGGYPLTIDANNPLRAQYNNNEVIETLSGPNSNTLTSIEADACQSGTWTKQ